MKIVVIGGTGLIGSKLVSTLREHGHEPVPAAPDTGVNTLAGEGLAEALKGASVVVDVSNSHRPRTRRRWSSSRRQRATSLTLKRPPALAITSRCRSWEANASPEADTSGPSSPRRN